MSLHIELKYCGLGLCMVCCVLHYENDPETGAKIGSNIPDNTDTNR